MYKPAVLIATLSAMLAVVLGAFGAHYLKTIFTPELLNSFDTGVKYQFYHSFALLAVGILCKGNDSAGKILTILFSAGVLLFSGSIYALCILKSNQQIGLGGLGILTPIGGLMFIAGWLYFFLSMWRQK
ncbi:MAG: DUF423 domain-containing protein [Chitinophagaceae bacterium]|nr:DUF423 domain-containing protein [Chitinophagaceae bacterium]